MKIVATLFIFTSNRDRSGNCYHAFRFVDHKTGKSVTGSVGCSGSSNIDAIRLYWNDPPAWTNAIQTVYQNVTKADFNRITEDWPYLGTDPQELVKKIKEKLAEN